MKIENPSPFIFYNLKHWVCTYKMLGEFEDDKES